MMMMMDLPFIEYGLREVIVCTGLCLQNCYQSKPDIYKSFLEILHNYQKEQKAVKEVQINTFNVSK